MSYFKVALTNVLERMKTSSGMTMQRYAARLQMPMSTLHNYVSGRRVSDPETLSLIISGFNQEDADTVIEAYIKDAVPEAWRQRVILRGVATPQQVTLSDYSFLPPRFRRHVELLLSEAQRNEHVVALVSELVALMGLEEPTASDLLCPPPKPGEFKTQKVPAGAVFTSARPGRSTSSLNEDAPASRQPASQEATSKPRATRAREALKQMQKREEGNSPS